MSSGSSSDSGSSSSSQTSSFDYESEAAGISNYAGSNYNDGQGDDRNTFDYEGAAYGTTPSASYTDTSGSNIGGSDIDSTYNASDAYFTPTQAEPTFAENVIGGVTDYVKGGGLIGMGINAVKDVFGTPENQYAGITGEDGYGEGDYVSTVGDWAESRGLTTDYSSEDLETQQVLDQQAFDAGFRSQSFNDLYQSGDTQNIQNLNQPESNLVKQLIPQAPFLVSGGQAPQSMVNDYFANIGGQSGLSNDLQTDYDAAKASVAQTLAINPLAQQFGYSTAPYGALTAQNTGTNPFNIPYLQTRGLI